MKMTLRLLALLLVATALVSTGPAMAAEKVCIPPDTTCGGGGGKVAGDDEQKSSGNDSANFNTSNKSCSVYANGGGMGMYCTRLGVGNAKSLRERFGDQKLQQCRYSELPSSIERPYNANPERGRYMLMSCIGSIDFDTYSGGNKRTLALSVVFVENGTDISDRHNGISDFLWNQFGTNAHMPVPFMQTRPNVTPLVGIPTYFTFRWLDPVSKDVVREGPYARKEGGGPFKEIERQGVTMRARATKVVVNPQQEGIPPVTCDPSTPYREGAKPKDQPANACQIVFPRTSASARKLATRPIPDRIKDAFYADVSVTWDVTYGADGGPFRTLGDGFTMRIRQVLPVQEVQAPNQPPAVIY